MFACLVVIVIVMIARRIYLKHASKKLSVEIPDINADLKRLYGGQFVTSRQEQEFTLCYSEIFKKCKTLFQKLENNHIVPDRPLARLIRDFKSIHELVKSHNDKFMQNQLNVHRNFFDHCLKYPLDRQQRRSIVSEEDNCLVVSSAGSGKTSSIVGKVKYLIEVKNVNPDRILLISYTNKAAAELTDRMQIPGLRGYTFHKLAIDIIGQVTGIKPSVCANADAVFIEVYQELLTKPQFKQSVVQYFTDWQDVSSEWEQKKEERRQLLSDQKNIRIQSAFPDMDGNAVYVRSEQENKICSILASLGVKFRYEEQYEHPVADGMHSQYRPDFSIYFEQGGETKRLYLEHFGVNEQGLVPAWFAKDRGISYDEATKRYNDGIVWKKEVHKKFGTQLISTTCADFSDGSIRQKLKLMLAHVGVPFQEKSDAELYEVILPKGGKREKAFIRLVATFVTLLKSGGKTVDIVLREASKANDERSKFIVKNIFQPVYDHFCKKLMERGEVDFTDIILQATSICHSKHPVRYEHIIVDEFQDISIDRYNFLKALRAGNPPAKLYCVGDDWQSIYRFSGSDMALFSRFSEYFGYAEINRIETTYRFGEPLVSMSSRFIQRNEAQIKKNIKPFNINIKTELQFCPYERKEYCDRIEELIKKIPSEKSIFLLGRYSFDDYYLSFRYKCQKEGGQFFYFIGGRKIEFMTVHKSKGLEADYVILLQCNKDTYGFPSRVSDDPVLKYVLTGNDNFPFGEERRLFYVAVTRAKEKTYVLYDRRFPSVFVDEFVHPEKVTETSYLKHPNANKRWTRKADEYLLMLYNNGASVKYIAEKMGRSQTSVIMRLNKLNE